MSSKSRKSKRKRPVKTTVFNDIEFARVGSDDREEAPGSKKPKIGPELALLPDFNDLEVPQDVEELLDTFNQADGFTDNLASSIPKPGRTLTQV
jgi:hypothetical protein